MSGDERPRLTVTDLPTFGRPYAQHPRNGRHEACATTVTAQQIAAPSLPGGVLTPLRDRQAALLWGAVTISLIGDGIYLVAIAWQALAISNTAATLSLVGVAWTLPTVIFLLAGGALSDRLDRRAMMIGAALAQGLLIAAIGALALTNSLTLAVLLALVFAYGAAEAFFIPAFQAIIPALTRPQHITTISALEQLLRPLSLQLLGPVIGGALIALGGTGIAFLVDATTFLVAAAALSAMRSPQPARRTGATQPGAGIADGFRYVRANPWLWGTLCAASLTLLFCVGPTQVLLPYLVKNELHASSSVYGTIRAIAGTGALTTAYLITRTGLPRRIVTTMLTAWALQSLTIAIYAAARGAWLFALAALAAGALGALGNTSWSVLMRTRVPNHLLGRVSSVDWFISVGLVPLSYAITAPLTQTIGPHTTLILAAAVGATTMLAFLTLPGICQGNETAPID